MTHLLVLEHQNAAKQRRSVPLLKHICTITGPRLRRRRPGPRPELDARVGVRELAHLRALVRSLVRKIVFTRKNNG